jgi:hypothetical protein
MVWAMKKGEPITHRTLVPHDISQIYTPGKTSLKFPLALFSCDADVAPRYYDDEGVTHVCDLNIEFKKAHLRHFVWKKLGSRSKSESCLLEYKVEILSEPENSVLRFRVLIGGEVVDGELVGAMVVAEGGVDFVRNEVAE